MGLKGDKATTKGALRAESIQEQLAPLGDISIKKMFGGHGIFVDSTMFGMVDSKGNCYLKGHDALAEAFGKEGFDKHSRMPYFKLPEPIMDDSERLKSWAERAIAGVR